MISYKKTDRQYYKYYQWTDRYYEWTDEYYEWTNEWTGGYYEWENEYHEWRNEYYEWINKHCECTMSDQTSFFCECFFSILNIYTVNANSRQAYIKLIWLGKTITDKKGKKKREVTSYM